MMQNKVLIGIAGGSGSGKSTVSQTLKELGYYVIDCDLVSRDVTTKDSICLSELVAEFGGGIIGERGELLRKKLGEIVFSDTEKLKKLNEITHKHIICEVMKRAEASSSKFVVIDGAALFESGISKNCKTIIGVLADKKSRIKRIMERDGLTYESAEKRIDAQKSDEFYIENCSYILYNNGNREDLEKQVREVVLKLDEE